MDIDDIKGMFKKKVSPEELKTKLAISEKKLEKMEEQLIDKQQKARDRAKVSLKNGDERGFRVASRRFGMINGQTQAISSMVEMATSMKDMLEMQEGLKEVVSIGSDLKQYQDRLGLDSKQLEDAMTTVRASMEKLNNASEIISTTMDAVTASSPESSKAQESLKKELMAELESEGTEEEELAKKIAEEEE
jgi:hypothetical protein